VPTRIFLTLVLPGATVVAAAATLLASAPDSAFTVQAGRAYPFVALCAALLLAARFQRSRSFVLALALAAAFAALRMLSPDLYTLGHALAATFLPLGIATVSLLHDAPVSSRRSGAQHALMFAAPLLAVITAAALPAETGALLLHVVIDPIYTSWSGLPQPALALWLLCICVVAARAIRSARAADAGLAWSALCTLLALAWPAESGRSIWLLAAGVSLVLALVESSRAMALHDDLTGLPARRALNQALASLRPPYVIAIVDVDHFKTFNDRYGHDVGDQVLRMVAARLERVGGGGTAYRSGGEEFTIVFPGLGKADAAPHLETVRAAVADAKFTLRAPDRPRDARGSAQRGRRTTREQKLGVTISVGFAAPGARTPAPDQVVKAADKAMYRAKKAGRNRVAA
jgi:GGDEF domain-containing protein